MDRPDGLSRQRVDWWGTLALIIAVVPPLIVAELGRTWGWTSRNALIAYAVSAFGISIFVGMTLLCVIVILFPILS